MGPIVARMPNFGLALRIASGLYLLHVAWKLWGHTEEMLLRKGGGAFARCSSRRSSTRFERGPRQLTSSQGSLNSRRVHMLVAVWG